MVLRKLELRHFRNLGVQQLRFPPEGVAVVGDNAQGKTNLLEAVYYLESFRSFRGAADGELVAFSGDVFHVRGTVGGDRPATVAAGFDRRRKRKKVTLDGDDTIRTSAALGRLGAVVFSPADVELVSGGPGGRRRYLDIVLSLNLPGYLEALQQYRRSLNQRNAALRSGAASGSSAWARSWDAGLVEHGAAVTGMRQAWVAEWAEVFARYHDAISGADPATLAYRPSLRDRTGSGAARRPGADPGRGPPPDDEALRDLFARRLDESWENDSRRGVTTVGPHRDELLLAFVAGGKSLPLRSYGSGGQRRTAALALRLTEAATIRRHRGAEPVLLLDDAFAELDRDRSGRVMELLEAEVKGQVILTVPRESDAALPGRALEKWRISAGVVEA